MSMASLFAELKGRAPVLLVFSLLLLLPISRLAELPLLVMAVLGLVRLWRDGVAVFLDPRVRLLSAVFLCYWVPILISAFGAVHPEKTWLVAAAVPRYWLAGLYVLSALRTDGEHALLWRVSAWLLVLWSLDALIQAAVGYNLMGYPHPKEPIARINGVFGMHNFKLGPVLALFSPLLIEHARRHWPRWLAASAILILTAVVLLTTTRIGWVMLAVVACGYVLLYAKRRPARTAVTLAAGLLVVLAVGTAAYFGSEAFRERIDRTAQVFRGTPGALDHALSARLPIWDSSLAMAADHWFNGVGARSFRYAYPGYAAPDDPWVREEEGIGATYAHHLLLELLTETGLVGLTGFALLLYLMLRAWRRATPPRRGLMFPYALALVAAVFPFNSHYAIYSTFWSITLWWLVMGFCGAAEPEADAPWQ